MVKKMTASTSLAIGDVAIHDEFWSPYIQLIKEVVIPYQWEVLNDQVEGAEPSHAIANLRIAAGLEEGEFYGYFFQDTDLAKWLEAVAYSLQTTPDPGLEKLADDAIDLVALAQQPDGYLNTYVTINGDEKRWKNLEECHELYTAGHFIEAAVAYHQATGKKKLLDIVCRFADYIDSVFGPEPDKIQGYDGHQEIELALVKLYRETGNDKYLQLSKYFLDERGKDPFFFEEEWINRNEISDWKHVKIENPQTRREYTQSHIPVRQQKEAVGHAVRLVYMLTGMAEVAKECGDEELLGACQSLWENIVTKQMYITGGIGSCSLGEAFTFNYDLPNDTAYSETCASIGLIVFAQRMLQIENKSCYSDVIEKALYNVIIASMARDGKHFFYVNPLEVWPEACEKNPVKEHVKAVRQKWFGCACCPPNLARLITSLGQYIYTSTDNGIFVHQFINSDSDFQIGGKHVKIKQSCNYPWHGDIKLEVSTEEAVKMELAIRIPGWCKHAVLSVDEKAVPLQEIMKDGYAILSEEFKNGSVIELKLDMPIELMQANPEVVADLGKAAIQRGPVVYCFEEKDNGANLFGISLNEKINSNAFYDSNLLTGAMVIEVDGYHQKAGSEWTNELYKPYQDRKQAVRLKAIPYCMWGNRNPGEMLVWIRVDK